MILSVAPIGEYDKRVVILTKEKGKYQRLQKGETTEQSACRGLVHLVISENSCCMKEEIPTLSSRQRSKIILQSSARMWKRHTMHFIFSNLQIFYTREANDEREMLKLLYPDDARVDERSFHLSWYATYLN